MIGDKIEATGSRSGSPGLRLGALKQKLELGANFGGCQAKIRGSGTKFGDSEVKTRGSRAKIGGI